jgi:hypothetical protein
VLFFGGVLVVLFILATLFFPRQIIALYKFGGGLYMVKMPFCIANQCVVPQHTGKECENKQCRHLVFVCESDLNGEGGLKSQSVH